MQPGLKSGRPTSGAGASAKRKITTSEILVAKVRYDGKGEKLDLVVNGKVCCQAEKSTDSGQNLSETIFFSRLCMPPLSANE